jgi:hypothetical protein
MFGVLAYTQIPQMVTGWPLNTPPSDRSFYCSPLIALDSIRGNEMTVYFAGSRNQIYQCNINGTPLSNWPFVFNDTILFGGSNLVIVDIDHDNRYEIIKYGSIRTSYHNPSAFLYDCLVLVDDDGTIMPGFPWLYTNTIGAINVADFNDDAEYEIMVSIPDSRLLFCFDRFGNIIDGWPIDLPSDVIGALPTSYCVGDLDLNGLNELIVAGLNHIYAFQIDGSNLPGFPITISDTSYYYCYSGAQPTLADLDHDGYPEIIATSSQWHPGLIFNSEIHIYEHTGAEKNPWPLYFPNAFISQNPIPADINGDGNLEIGFQADTSFYFVDIAKIPLQGWPRTYRDTKGQIRYSFTDFIIVDLNGDRHCEIFTDFNFVYTDSIVGDTTRYFSYSPLFGIDYLGNELPAYPIRIGGAYFRMPPHFGYYKPLNRLYMGMATESYTSENGHAISFELYQYPDSTGPADQWPMLSHDLLMTRNYNFVDNAASDIRENPDAVPNSFCVRQNYPNPFNSSTVIRYDLPNQAIVTIKIYNILGQAIATLADGIQPPGRHSTTWNADNSPSGVYFCQIQTGEYLVTRKMMLIK